MQTVKEAAKEAAKKSINKLYDKNGTSSDSYIRGFQEGVEFAQRWIPVEEELPTCLERGNWDGLRSYFCLVKFQDESIDIARMYKGKMDGFEFQDWYDKIDFDFGSSIITHWRPIEYPIL